MMVGFHLPPITRSAGPRPQLNDVVRLTCSPTSSCLPFCTFLQVTERLPNFAGMDANSTPSTDSRSNSHAGVTVLGLGKMGAALGRAFLAAGRPVTVWNRTTAKAAGLGDSGANVATTPEAAVAASPTIVICLSDYAATRAVLDQPAVAAALAGRTIIQLSTGTPQQARDASVWAASMGADYLDGAIGAWPRQIGTAEAGILVSGSDQLYMGRADLVSDLGTQVYLGEDVAGANAMFTAVLSYLAGRWIGFSHGAAICEAEGLDPAAFGGMLASMSSAFAEDDSHMGTVISNDTFDKPESTLRTAGTDVARLVAHAQQTGIDLAFPELAAGLFQRAIDAGHGDEEHVALVKVMRPA